MIAHSLVHVITSDIAGKARGKAFPVAQLEQRLQRGIGWTPTNVQITCFDVIAESPFGALGDLLLMPDRDARVMLNFEDGGPVRRFMIGNITDLAGNPWQCCTRAILKTALDRLKTLAGVTLCTSFEHEFQFKTDRPHAGEAYTLQGFERQRRFGETLIAALEQAGLKADTFMKEFGPDQYEITIEPSTGYRSADEAVILRELVRMTARLYDQSVTFSPILNPDTVGNGVHIHMSFFADGTPRTYDEKGVAGMSSITGSFISGLLRYLDSIIAFTAPSDISYLRLTPHRWSAAYNNLGFHDREAAVRICPVSATDSEGIARQFNFEFRAADAAASPHLALAAIIHAGAQGIEDGLPSPEVTQEDLSVLSDDALSARGYVRLPKTLEEALERLRRNDVVRSWFTEDFIEVYLAHKQGELACLKGMNVEERCALYAKVY